MCLSMGLTSSISFNVDITSSTISPRAFMSASISDRHSLQSRSIAAYSVHAPWLVQI